MKMPYAGIILTPDGWVVCRVKSIYDAFDMREGPLREALLTTAEEMGALVRLGPPSMNPEQVVAAVSRVYGMELPSDPRLLADLEGLIGQDEGRGTV